MKQGVIKGLLALGIMGCLITACSKEDPDPNGSKKRIDQDGYTYTFPDPEPGTTLYPEDAPQWQNKPFEAVWSVNNQAACITTRLEFVWDIPVVNHVTVQSYPNEFIFAWLINASGKYKPKIVDQEWGDYCFEYKGKSGRYQYYEYSEEFASKALAGKGPEYGVRINDEHYTVYLSYLEPPTALYDRENEIFSMYMKVSGVRITKHLDEQTIEEITHQYNPVLDMILVTTKSLPYSY